MGRVAEHQPRCVVYGRNALRETLTIGTSDDYTDWRYRRGSYDIGKVSESANIRFEGRPKREGDIE